MRLVSLYGRPNLDFEPMLASLPAEAGLALVAGGLLKLWHSGVLSEAAMPRAESDLAGVRS